MKPRELTEGEKMMMTTGLVFSVSTPNTLFIKNGLEGGSYVCEAFIIDTHMELFIYDMTLVSESKKISLNGNEVHHITVYSWLSFTDEGVLNERYNSNIDAYGTTDYLHEIEIKSDRYEGLPLDTQSKRFFIDILGIYLKEKKEASMSCSEEVATEESINSDRVSPV